MSFSQKQIEKVKELCSIGDGESFEELQEIASHFDIQYGRDYQTQNDLCQMLNDLVDYTIENIQMLCSSPDGYEKLKEMARALGYSEGVEYSEKNDLCSLMVDTVSQFPSAQHGVDTVAVVSDINSTCSDPAFCIQQVIQSIMNDDFIAVDQYIKNGWFDPTQPLPSMGLLLPVIFYPPQSDDTSIANYSNNYVAHYPVALALNARAGRTLQLLLLSGSPMFPSQSALLSAMIDATSQGNDYSDMIDEFLDVVPFEGNQLGPYEESPLLLAAEHNMVDLVRRLMDYGYSPYSLASGSSEYTVYDVIASQLPVDSDELEESAQQYIPEDNTYDSSLEESMNNYMRTGSM